MTNSPTHACVPKKPVANAVSAQVRYGRIIGTLPLCLAASAMAAENHQDKPAEQPIVLEKVIVTSKFPSAKALGATEMEADILTSPRLSAIQPSCWKIRRASACMALAACPAFRSYTV